MGSGRAEARRDEPTISPEPQGTAIHPAANRQVLPETCSAVNRRWGHRFLGPFVTAPRSVEPQLPIWQVVRTARFDRVKMAACSVNIDGGTTTGFRGSSISPFI